MLSDGDVLWCVLFRMVNVFKLHYILCSNDVQGTFSVLKGWKEPNEGVLFHWWWAWGKLHDEMNEELSLFIINHSTNSFLFCKVGEIYERTLCEHMSTLYQYISVSPPTAITSWGPTQSEEVWQRFKKNILYSKRWNKETNEVVHFWLIYY